MKRVCKKCHEEKDLIEFYKSRSGRDGFMATCKKCEAWRKTLWCRKRSTERAQKEGWKLRRYTLDARQDREAGVKYCPRCQVVMPLKKFYTNKANSDGYTAHCIKCMNELGRSRPPEEKHAYYLRTKDYGRNMKLLKKFGITLETYKVMLKSQNGVCSICGKTPEENKKLLAVDHTHNGTCKVRGLLCNNCNVAIGFLAEDKNRALMTIKYLEKWESNQGDKIEL